MPDFENYYNKLLLNRFDDKSLEQVLNPVIFEEYLTEKQPLFPRYLDDAFSSVRSTQFVDMNTFMVDDILAKVDRASMAHSLEVRIPFLDHRLVEAVFLLSERDFPKNSIEKPVLKEFAKSIIPKDVLKRQKKGFSAPVTSWRFYKNAHSEILNGRAIDLGILQKDFVLKLIDGKIVNSSGMLWMLFCFEKWLKTWGI